MVAKRLTTPFSAEEVLLENVELIPEAFDCLQLPFPLKTGMIYAPTWTVWLDGYKKNTIAVYRKLCVVTSISAGRWKKLGWTL